MNYYNIKLHLQINKAKFITKEHPIFNEELLRTSVIKICESIGYLLDNTDLLIYYNNNEYDGLIHLSYFEAEIFNVATKEQFINEFEKWSKDVECFYFDNYKLSIKAHYIKSGVEQIIFKNFSIQDWFYFRNIVSGMGNIFNINYELKDEKDFYFERCGIQYVLECI